MNGMLSVTSRTVTNYEEAGAPVSQTAALADALQIMPSFMLNSVPYVTVDFGKTAERVRFDIAHGMGI